MTVSQAGERARKLNMESITWGDMTWIDIAPPAENETRYLGEKFGFHPLDLDDCLSRIQRPKIDQYEKYLFLVLHFPVFHKEVKVTRPSQLSVFIGPDYLVTLHRGTLKPLVKFFRDCQLDEEARQQNFSQGSGYLLYRIIDRLVDYCIPILSRIGSNIERTENTIFASRVMPRAIEELSILRRDVISFRRIIWPMRAVIASLEPKIRRFTGMDLSVYFGDMIDHMDKIWDGLDEYKEIIEGLNDTYDSLANHHTGEVMRMLTVIATVLMPFLGVSGIYGMNVALPGGLDEGSLMPFFLLLLAMFLLTGGMLAFLRWRRWI